MQKKALITSAYELSDAEILSIKKSVPAISEMTIETKVDHSLIGGFIVRYGTEVVDASFRTMMQQQLQTVS